MLNVEVNAEVKVGIQNSLQHSAFSISSHHSSTLTLPRSIPSSVSIRGTSATIVSGPQTKQSVAGSSTRGPSWSSVIRPRAPCQASGASRVTCRRRSRPPSGRSNLGHLAELWQIGEVVGGLGAVQQPQPPALSRQQRLSNHGAYRRDAGAAGDEQKVSFRRARREQERAERSLNAQAHPRRDCVEQVAPPS